MMHLRADSCITELLGRKNGEYLVDRDGVKTGHATHPWLPLRIIWFAMAAFVWSVPFMASIWLNIKYINRISHGIRSFLDRQLNQKNTPFSRDHQRSPSPYGIGDN